MLPAFYPRRLAAVYDKVSNAAMKLVPLYAYSGICLACVTTHIRVHTRCHNLFRLHVQVSAYNEIPTAALQRFLRLPPLLSIRRGF